MRRTALALVAVIIGLLWPASALADSASVVSFQDAGVGRVTVTYTLTSTATDEIGFKGWYGTLAVDHASRACNTAWANYLRDVVPFSTDVGSMTRTVTFLPFFPRQIKLCIYLNNPAGHRAVLEQVYSIPAGYGVQRSSGYNCEHFSRYSAQDYYWLYPGDPSGLDADNDGAACEENSGPGPGPQIPAEPTPPTPPPPACSDGIDNDGDGRTDLLDSACLSPNGTSEGAPPAPRQCSDGADNDGDGAIDLADGQCKRRSDPREAADPLPKLTLRETKFRIRHALGRKFTAAYRHGSFKRIQRCARASRTRMSCRVSWSIGDLGYDGRVTIWLDNADNGDVWWFYSLRIKRTNEYCVVRKRAGDPSYRGKRCTKFYRVQ